MKVSTLIAAAPVVAVANGQIIAERAPVPGVLSMPFTPSRLSKRADAFVDVSLGARYFNYIVNITVGTPPQPVTLSLDTGSSDTIVLTERSTYCIDNDPTNIFCPTTGYYNANKSSTYKFIQSNFSSQFGFADQGQASGAKGDVATDNFVVGATTLKAQQFAIAYGPPSIAFSILGLSYASGENQVNTNPPQPKYNNFPLSLAAEKITNLAAFSLWKDAPDSHNGQLLFGGVDTSKYTGSLTTLETIIRPNFTEIIAFDTTLNGVALSGNTSFPKGTTGSIGTVLDCGTSFTILPDEWTKPIYDQFNVQYFDKNGTAYADCLIGQKPYTINFTFNSLTIAVPIKSMLTQVSQNRCSFGIVPAGDRWPLLGDNFLSSAYSVFDLTNNQISLAQRDFSNPAAKVVAMGTGGVANLGTQTSNPAATTTGAQATSTETKKSGSAALKSNGFGLAAVGLFAVLFI